MPATKALAIAFLVAAIGPTVAQPAPAQPPRRTAICLNVKDIQNTVSKDGKVLTFTMRDGTVYNNHLRQSCDSLVFGGFVWTIPSTQEVCEDVQTLRAITTGEICRLGRFDPPIKKASAAH
jgi:hypothetical protein